MLTVLLTTAGGFSRAQSGARLTVAWVADGKLVIWQQDDASPRTIVRDGVVRPLLAADGRHIAFTRGAQGLPEALWVIASDGSDERPLAARDDLHPPDDDRIFIGDLAWLDESVLLFNTVRQRAFVGEARDDLYRADISSGQVTQLLPPGAGGRFTVSPDRQHIAVASPGVYGEPTGRIRVMDPLAQTPDDLMTFVGVATGAEQKFYPAVDWEADSAALRVAIPHRDLVYNDVESPPTVLWRLSLDGARERLGSAPASFFGQPRWSASGDHLTYLQRVGNATSGQFDLVLAAGVGANPAVSASGQIGSFQPAQWVPGSTRFIYAQGEAGALWLGAPGGEPRRIPNENEPAFQPVFVNDSLYVFASAATGPFDLRYTALDDAGAPSLRIATVNNPFPVFDAVVTS